MIAAVGTGVTGPTGPAGGGGGGDASGIAAVDVDPAFGYTNVQGALDLFKGVLNPVPTGGGSFDPSNIMRKTYVAGVQGRHSSAATGYVAVGSIRFDPADYRPSIPESAPVVQHVNFGALLETSSGLTGTIQLFDLSVGTGVPASLLSTTISTPTYVISPDLGLTAGVDYEVQIKLGSSATGPTGADEVVVKQARLEISHE